MKEKLGWGLTLLSKGEVFRQVSALVVAAQEEESQWIGHFQREEVKDTLK